MRIKMFLLAPFLFGFAALFASSSKAQESSLPPQIDSRIQIVAWADVDKVSFEEFLKWTSKTELSLVMEATRLQGNPMPAEFVQKLRKAGAKRIYLATEVTALMGDPSQLGVIIRCDQPDRCEAALAAEPLLPGQILKSIEGAVLMAFSPQGLEALAEIEGQPSKNLAEALESSQDPLGVASAIPPAVISFLIQSAPKDGSPMSKAVSTLVDLKWFRIAGSPPDSKLKGDAAFNQPEQAAEFAKLVNSVVTAEFGAGKNLNLLEVAEDRVKLVNLNENPLRQMLNNVQNAARTAENQSRLRMLGLAMFNYESAYSTFPPQALADKTGKRLLSWRVLILPFLGEKELYDQFHLDEAWDSPHNLALLEKMPEMYRSAGDIGASELKPGYTRFVAPLAANSIMGKVGTPTRLREVADGLSNTILLVQAAPSAAVPWTKPEDLKVDLSNPISGMAGAEDPFFLTLFGDGASRLIEATVNKESLLAYIDKDDGAFNPDEASLGKPNQDKDQNDK